MNTFIKKIFYTSIFALIFSAVIVQAYADSTSVQDSNVNIQNKKMNIVVKDNNNYKFYGFFNKNNKLYPIDSDDTNNEVNIVSTEDQSSYSFDLSILNIINQDARLRFKKENSSSLFFINVSTTILNEKSCSGIANGILNSITFSLGLDGNLNVVCEI